MDVDTSSLQPDSRRHKSVGFGPLILRSSNESSELSPWLCCDDSTVNVLIMIRGRLLMSSMASIACWFQEPAVSMAVGMKMCVAMRTAYLAVFEFAALLAADPAWAEVASMRKSAKVFGTVTSHAVGFPLDRGMMGVTLLLLLLLQGDHFSG